MMKPKRLKKGDKVAVVSLSWGGLGDKELIHKYDIAKKRMEDEFGLEVVAMPHALKGTEFIARHPNLRAQDLMEAFRDDTVSAIFCAIGGDDTIRLLPFIDDDVIKRHPKIFMGYSDSTVNHLMLYKAGLVSFYGPCVMVEFGEYVSMFDYTKEAVNALLFSDSKGYRMPSSPQWCDEFVPWDEANRHTKKRLKPDEHGYELLQGKGKVSGHLLGGCLDVFTMCIGTSIWPTLDDWRGAILFIETSEEQPKPDFVKWMLRNLAAQGILKVINGILVGKPQGEVYYDEYKAAIMQVVADEEQLTHLPIIYNVNFGHAAPIGVLPYGITAEIDADKKSITLLESATE
jgi:muramoyltetrapeptide carboxypeptidase LdcA involved in peptidoglycan recycling